MRLFKLMVCFALLSSIALVGCNKDKNDVEELVPTLAMGEYIAMSETADCPDKELNYTEIFDCTEDCYKIVINTDMTVQYFFIWGGQTSDPFNGTYTISGNKINFDFSNSMFEEIFELSDKFEGIITADNNFDTIQLDEFDDCQYNMDFAK